MRKYLSLDGAHIFMNDQTPIFRNVITASVALICLLSGMLHAAPKTELANPDFTQGGSIPAEAKHDWNLGATGLRGWMFCDKMVTTDARQIAITKVDPGTPADGIIQVGDVILGVNGKPFSYDPRTEFGKAITVAESEAGSGKLNLSRWRNGATEEVTLTLPVLGTYSPTAPYDCPKSKRIIEQSGKALAAKLAKNGGSVDPIVRSLNGLGLLATGNPEYLPLIKKEVEWAANYSENGMQTWRYGYIIMLLAEYTMATGDQSAMPGLRRLAMESAKGQSAVGSWGHAFALPDGRLKGYGMMNSPGAVLTISLVMARNAGVKDPEVAKAIELSAKLLRFYTGKGSIPYGDHHPWIENHDDNGKNGMAAVLFNLMKEKNGAEFFSRMSVASHGPERDTGHTGNYFNILWAMPGVSISGPKATGAWMKEYGSWYYDLARRWDGMFPHQGPPEPKNDSYGNWDCTGVYLIAYCQPLKKIMLTGKLPGTVAELKAAEAEMLIADGRGWDNKDRNSFYDALTNEQLIERLGSWSPIVRERASLAIGRRRDFPVEPVLALLQEKSLEPRYGACQAIEKLRGRAEAAVPTLVNLLRDKDLWMRIKAADALASIGKPAMSAVPTLLEIFSQTDPVNDPRGMQQRYLCFALFDGRGMLANSLEGVDRAALYKAVRGGLQNQDGRARGSIASVYRNLSTEEIKPLLPVILEAVKKPAPSGEMFADQIRVEGLRVLANHKVAEGIDACVQYTRLQNPWSSENRTPELMKILLTYGKHAEKVIPTLENIANYFEKEEKDFPRHLMMKKAQCVRETIRSIEAATESPTLIRISR
mgnify:CR=1 FL=1